MKTKVMLTAIGLFAATLTACGIAWAAAGNDGNTYEISVQHVPGGSTRYVNVREFSIEGPTSTLQIQLENKTIVYSPHYWGKLTITEVDSTQ